MGLGHIATTAADLLRWLELNINHGRIGDVQVLPREAFETAHRQQADVDARFGPYRRFGYALGWYWSDYDGQTLLHHFGGFAGWRAHVSFNPETKDGVAVVTNTSGFGFDLPDLIANYVYDRTVHEDRIAALRKEIDEGRQKIREHAAERAARKPTLLHDLSVYTGRYSNYEMGDLTIVRSGSDLRASIGQLDSRLEPYTEPETARVELVPGSGDVLRFDFDDAGRVKAVVWRGERFEKRD